MTPESANRMMANTSLHSCTVYFYLWACALACICRLLLRCSIASCPSGEGDIYCTINNVYQTSAGGFAVHNKLVSKSDSIKRCHILSMYSIVLHFLVTPSIGLSGLSHAIGFVNCKQVRAVSLLVCRCTRVRLY